MKKVSHILRLPVAVLLLGLGMSSCNKDVPDAVPNTFPQPTGKSMADIINADTSYSFLKAGLTRAGMLDLLGNPASVYTFIAPKNSAFRLSGIPSVAVVNALPLTLLVPALQYHIIPGQVYSSLNITNAVPNNQLPTSLIFPAPNTNPLVRFTTFPSRRDNGVWVNNIPIVAADITASNGIMHNPLTLVMPPTRSLWDRINTDTVSSNNKSLSYLRAAIIRADSGQAPTSLASLIYTLSYPPVNATIFAPTDSAFRSTLTLAVTAALMKQGMPQAQAFATATALCATPAVFSNPALYAALPAQTVKGIVVYHLVLNRTFTNNIPVTATQIKTALNSAIPTHPGLTISSVFAGPFVGAATVKGLYNASAAKIYINPTPEPNGWSDQHYYNGVIHKIDQVLIPLPL